MSLLEDTAKPPETGATGPQAAPRTAAVELLVCTTCRHGDPADDGPRPGALLLERLESAALPAGVAVRAVECLSNCSRGCTIALRGPGRWTYVYGDVDPETQAAVVLDGAMRYAASGDGLVPWRERPEHFRKHCIARIPPLEA
jgi:predicted metal-binding protein